MTYVEASWKALFERLKSMDAKRIYVAGGPDSGKTTLAHFLTHAFASIKPTSLIDSDPGQSTINLPTTVSAAFYSTADQAPKEIFSRFIGDTSPHRRPSNILLALHRLSEKVMAKGAECTIYDSCGFIIGQEAMEFQIQVIEMLHVDVVVLLQREHELERFETLLQKFGTITIEKLPVSQAVRPKSMPMRKENREAKYRRYFEGQKLQVLDVKDLALCGALPERYTVQSMRGRLLAFCDHEKFLLALAVARSFYDNDKICICLAPEFDLNQAAFLHFGDIFLNAEFKEEHGNKKPFKNKVELKLNTENRNLTK